MQDRNESFKYIVQDIKDTLEVRGFEIKRPRLLKTVSGMENEVFIVENGDLSLIIRIQECEKLPPT